MVAEGDEDEVIEEEQGRLRAFASRCRHSVPALRCNPANDPPLINVCSFAPGMFGPAAWPRGTVVVGRALLFPRENW